MFAWAGEIVQKCIFFFLKGEGYSDFFFSKKKPGQETGHQQFEELQTSSVDAKIIKKVSQGPNISHTNSPTATHSSFHAGIVPANNASQWEGARERQGVGVHTADPIHLCHAE